MYTPGQGSMFFHGMTSGGPPNMATIIAVCTAVERPWAWSLDDDVLPPLASLILLFCLDLFFGASFPPSLERMARLHPQCNDSNNSDVSTTPFFIARDFISGQLILNARAAIAGQAIADPKPFSGKAFSSENKGIFSTEIAYWNKVDCN